MLIHKSQLGKNMNKLRKRSRGYCKIRKGSRELSLVRVARSNRLKLSKKSWKVIKMAFKVAAIIEGMTKGSILFG